MRNMRLKNQIIEYVDDKEEIRLRDLIGWLNDRGRKIYGVRKVAGNLTTLGWRRETHGDDLYQKIGDKYDRN